MLHCTSMCAVLKYHTSKAEAILPYLTLPARRMPALGRHPALRPQHGPSAHPRQTGRYNLLEALANIKRRKQWMALSVSSERVK